MFKAETAVAATAMLSQMFHQCGAYLELKAYAFHALFGIDAALPLQVYTSAARIHHVPTINFANCEP